MTRLHHSQAKKLVELPYLIESDTLDGRVEGQYRTISVADFKPGNSYGEPVGLFTPPSERRV